MDPTEEELEIGTLIGSTDKEEIHAACFDVWVRGKGYGGSKPMLMFKRLGTLSRWFYATEKSDEREDLVKLASDGW